MRRKIFQELWGSSRGSMEEVWRTQHMERMRADILRGVLSSSMNVGAEQTRDDQRRVLFACKIFHGSGGWNLFRSALRLIVEWREE